MTLEQLQAKLNELRALPVETEWAEFKLNKEDPQEIGEYLSALSNSAALYRQPFGYIVWGVENGTHNILGTSFKPRTKKGKGNEDLEPWLARNLSPKIDFTIHEFTTEGKRIVLFKVQAANTTPVAFCNIKYIRVGSCKKPLKDYPEKEREVWRLLSDPRPDWSAQICAGATLVDLDAGALASARLKYKGKHAKLADEVDGWDDLTLLNKAKVTINGQITRAAMILLGKEESVHYLSPAVARVTWILKDSQGIEQDYSHFSPPFLLNVDRVYKKIRNLTLRALGGDTLFPREISKYDDWVIREALHNCIAHQDYTQGGQINLIEEDDSILFTNLGNFIPGSVENVIQRDAPEETYRNRLLAEAMVNLNMIDTIGSGIKRMFRKQKERFLPMPDYDLSDPRRVKVRIIGKILNERFTRLLITRTDLDLVDVIVLDKVQKRQPIAEDAFRSLKRRGLVEGRKTAPIISAAVAVATGQEADYIHSRGSDKIDCKRKVVDYLKQFESAVRKKFEELLFPMLSTALGERQKRDFVKNLIQEMKREGTLRKASGERSDAVWVLSKPEPTTRV